MLHDVYIIKDEHEETLDHCSREAYIKGTITKYITYNTRAEQERLKNSASPSNTIDKATTRCRTSTF
jgi:hypothetical protein